MHMCNVCGGGIAGTEELLLANELRCDRCKTVVDKLIGYPDSALMPGGAVREVDAFTALAAVAPDEWKKFGSEDGRRSALVGGGLRRTHALRQWLEKLLKACATERPVTITDYDRAAEIEVKDRAIGFNWRRQFNGVQLSCSMAEAKHGEVTTWAAIPSTMNMKGFHAVPTPFSPRTP